MNKKGVTAIAIILAIFYFLIGMTAYQFLKPDITIQRDSDHLNCASADTDGDRVTCLVLDSIIPIIIITFLSVAGGIVTDRIK